MIAEEIIQDLTRAIIHDADNRELQMVFADALEESGLKGWGHVWPRLIREGYNSYFPFKRENASLYAGQYFQAVDSIIGYDKCLSVNIYGVPNRITIYPESYLHYAQSLLISFPLNRIDIDFGFKTVQRMLHCDYYLHDDGVGWTRKIFFERPSGELVLDADSYVDREQMALQEQMRAEEIFNRCYSVRVWGSLMERRGA